VCGGNDAKAQRKRERKTRDQRGWRRRSKVGKAIARMPYTELIVRYLRWLGALTEEHADDPGEIGKAAFKVLEESAEAARRRGLI
jgi:hypothetical protein